LAEFNQHEPAPAVLALVAYLKDLARSSLPHFAIAYCMLEAEPLLARKTLEQIKATEKKTNLSLTGHAAHVKKDLSMAHRDLWRTTLRAFYPREIRKSELNALFNSIHRMRHILIHWNDGIHFRAKEAVELSKILKTSSPHTLIRHPFSPNLTFSGARGRK
jgi:hypothetical protein